PPSLRSRCRLTASVPLLKALGRGWRVADPPSVRWPGDERRSRGARSWSRVVGGGAPRALLSQIRPVTYRRVADDHAGTADGQSTIAISVGGVADYRSPGHEDTVTRVPARGVARYDAVRTDHEPVAVRRPRRALIEDADAVPREDAVLDDGAPADRDAAAAGVLDAH